MRPLRLALAALALGLAPPAPASDWSSFAAGARALGMGEGGAAAATGPEAAFWNPAGVPASEWRLLGSQDTWVADLIQGSLALSAPEGRLGAWHLQGQWRSWGSVEQRDGLGRLTGISDPLNFSGSLGWGKTWGWSRIGLAGGAEGTGGPVDGRVHAGAQAFWLGGVLGAALLADARGPLRSQISLSQAISSEHVGASLSGGWIEEGPDSRAGLGLEWNFGRLFQLRGGYQWPQNSGVEGLRYFSYGAGLSWGDLQLDYAVLGLGQLGQAHRFQAGARFQGRKPATPTALPSPSPTPSPTATPSATATPSPRPSPQPSPTPTPQPKGKGVEMKFVIPD